MTDDTAILNAAHAQALAYRVALPAGPCKLMADFPQMQAAFAGSMPETGEDAAGVIDDLAQRAGPGLAPMAHPNFFGWVLGGSHPAGVAADWLVSAWGQNSAFHSSTPATAAIEQTASRWLLDLLDLPPKASVGFVTGATVGSFTALAAARHRVLENAGWDLIADGLCGAPPITVFLGDDAHAAIPVALKYLGIGTRAVRHVATDTQGRMDTSALATAVSATKGPKIIVAQAGQINTGAFDDFTAIAQIAKDAGAWLHIDGAFGLWARCHPDYRHLTDGIDAADSWAVDGHKWLQTPFDTGYAIVRDQTLHETVMGIDASYLPDRGPEDRAPSLLAPELSRRARGVPTWAILKSLGRSGVQDMVARHCCTAKAIADRLAEVPGITVMNDVVLNQAIVAFGDPIDDAATKAVIAALQDRGDLYVGGAQWKGHHVMRISVICCATQEDQAETVADHIRLAWESL